ncbi:MAG: hypothetical protein FWG57_04335 [Endomicrobia bacterium]|nr:hypothetical protein [Endomicrobiia bacterium]
MLRIPKAHSFRVLPILLLSALLGGCASGMNGYYAKLQEKLDAGEFEAAAKFVDGSRRKYGRKNVLLFYYDSGFVNHLAENYERSTRSFESAKVRFDELNQRSITAGVASMFFNDSTIPYQGEDFERAHVNVFGALNFIGRLDPQGALIEARQINALFRMFAAEGRFRNLYNDDGFIRYLMGLVYENGGEINDAHISYMLALRAYRNGIVSLSPPQDLINDAYTTALMLGMRDRAEEIKRDFPSARRAVIPSGHGELIIINYNGMIPRKVENVLEFALFDIWPYVNQVQVSTDEQRDFERARSVAISAFADTYIRVSFPRLERIPNRVKSFSVTGGQSLRVHSYEAQDLAEIAEKILKDNIVQIYAKTLARAAVKHVLGRNVSKAVGKQTNETWGVLTQIFFNIFNSWTSVADTRSWRTLPENILMARIYLPAGENVVTVEYSDSNGQRLKSETFTVNIENGRKTFKVLRSAM